MLQQSDAVHSIGAYFDNMKDLFLLSLQTYSIFMLGCFCHALE